jgi:hypothetical protein
MGSQKRTVLCHWGWIVTEDATKGSLGFTFHSKCNVINLTHLCFADDLLIFSTVNLFYVRAVREVLDEFECL